jgi:hypothetical protein
MMQRMKALVRRGEVGGKTVGIYILLWLLGVPGLLLILLFALGVGR